MSSAAVAPTGRPTFRVRTWWLLAASLAVIAVPTLFHLSEQSWSRESGAHGPIILATGAWLLFRQLPQIRREASPGRPAVSLSLLAVALVCYVFGRAYDFITLEAGGVYGAGVAMLHATIGPRLLWKNWFPLFYLAFAIPPPEFVLDALTSPLKQFVSMVTTDMLTALGYPISREGVIILIAQYELLVEDACSGMNSLVGLTAVSLFYIYLTRGSSWRYATLLTAFVIPIAILANMIRIVLLVLMTYYLGDQFAQGFAHSLAGVVLFATALIMVFAVDQVLGMVLARRRRAP
jgi:exosortase B